MVKPCHVNNVLNEVRINKYSGEENTWVMG